MAAQLTYSRDHAKAYPGMIVDLGDKDIISKSIESVAGADFGIAVSRGTDKDNQAIIGGADFLGFTVRELSREGAANSGSIKYDEKSTAAIMRKGNIYMVCPSGCNPGDPVNYVIATGVVDSGVAVAGEINVLGAEWDTVAAAGELAVIRIETAINTSAG